MAIFGVMVFTCGLVAEQFGHTFDTKSIAAGTAITAISFIILEWGK